MKVRVRQLMISFELLQQAFCGVYKPTYRNSLAAVKLILTKIRLKRQKEIAWSNKRNTLNNATGIEPIRRKQV